MRASQKTANDVTECTNTFYNDDFGVCNFWLSIDRRRSNSDYVYANTYTIPHQSRFPAKYAKKAAGNRLVMCGL
jgi:hypothetical protein